MSKKRESQYLKEWHKLRQIVRKATTISTAEESNLEKQLRIEKLLSNYKLFVEYYFPHYAEFECAHFHIEAANEIRDAKEISILLRWFRGAAKSVHLNIFIPLWLKALGELKYFVLVGQNETAAKRLLGDPQAELMDNQRYTQDFGQQYQTGDWSEKEFTTSDGCTFTAIGIGQSPRGLRKAKHRPDFISIDDVDTQQLSKNPRRVDELSKWIEEDLAGCFDIGNQRIAIAGNLFSKNSINYVLGKKKSWQVLQVNALDANGEPSWKAKFDKAYYERKRKKGERAFQREYMNNPIEEGKVFKKDWIKFVELPNEIRHLSRPILGLKQQDPSPVQYSIIAYCDPSFSSGGDYKAVRTWVAYQKKYYCVQSWVRKTSITAMFRYLYQLHETYQDNGIELWIEEQFIQDYLMSELDRITDEYGYYLPIRRDTRNKPNKEQRIEGMQPLYENGLMYFDEAKKGDADFEQAEFQLLSFEKGSSVNDDAPDADEGAIYILRQKQISNIHKPTFIQRVKKRLW